MRKILSLLIVLFIISIITGCIQTQPLNNTSIQNNSTYPVLSIIPTKNSILSQSPTLNITENKVFKGTPFTYLGHTQIQNITAARIWIFGKDSVKFFSIPVKNEEFNITLTEMQTQEMDRGNYTIIVQYPESGNTFFINPITRNGNQFILDKNGNLLIDLSNIGRSGNNGLDYAKLLINEINISGTGDTFSEIPLFIEEYSIIINPIGDHRVGDQFIINGTTNLPTDSQLNLEVVSGINLRSIKCEVHNQDEYESCSNSLLRQTNVKKGFPNNTWNFGVNTSNLRPSSLNGELSFIFFVVVNGKDPNTGVIIENSTSFNLTPNSSQFRSH